MKKLFLFFSLLVVSVILFNSCSNTELKENIIKDICTVSSDNILKLDVSIDTLLIIDTIKAKDSIDFYLEMDRLSLLAAIDMYNINVETYLLFEGRVGDKPDSTEIANARNNSIHNKDIERLKKSPQDLALIYKVVYTANNPFLGNVKQQLTRKYIINLNQKTIIRELK